MKKKSLIAILIGIVMIFTGLIIVSSTEKTQASSEIQEKCEPCPGEGAENNPCSENSFTRWMKLYPDKTILEPGESFNLKIDWYRTCWCPSDYFKILYKNEATGEITEAGRHAEPYWTMCTSYCTESYTQALTAPEDPGTYTIKVVHASGHGEWWCGYYDVNWNCPRADGGFVGHKPEELRWDFYEMVAEFKITVGRIFPDKAKELAKEVLDAPYLWGGKGYDFSTSRFAIPGEIKSGYAYYNPDKRKKDYGSGLDCSGLSFWSYNRAYYDGQIVNWRKCIDEKNPECPVAYEGASGQYQHNSYPIEKEDLKRGDLLFFDTNKDGWMDHVAMYVGNEEVIHAEGVLFKKIVKENLDTVLSRYSEYFRGFRRVKDPKIKLTIIGNSPVDLIVIDPDGFIVSLENPWEGPMEYQVFDIDGDGELEDIVITGERKIGNYLIQVVPEPDALPADTYSLEVTADGETIVLAENVPISDIPRRPYILRSTETEIILIIPAFVDFDPDTLNLESEGKWSTVYLELPKGYNIEEIDLENLLLNGKIKPESKPIEIGDYDENGVPDLMMKFNRLAVEDILEAGEEVKVTISGNLIDGKPFEGSDVIRVIK